MKKRLGYCLFANKGYPLERECATARGMRCDLCGFFSHGGEKRMGGRIVQLLNDYNHMKIIQPISALIPWESYDYQGHVKMKKKEGDLLELIYFGQIMIISILRRPSNKLMVVNHQIIFRQLFYTVLRQAFCGWEI